MNTTKRGVPDFTLLVLIMVLVGFGLLFVYSSSTAIYSFESDWFVKRQGFNIFIGITSMMIFMNINYKIWKKLIVPFFFLIIILLLLTLVAGQEINNAKSWLRVAGFSLQPSEFAKLFIVVYLASIVSKKMDKINNLKKGLLPPLFIVGIISVLIMLQPDLGTTFIIISTALILFFVGGARIKHFLLLGGIGIVSSLILVPILLNDGYRMKRIQTFINPMLDPTGHGYQILNSLFAFGHGGVMGAGFGKSVQKLGYLPLPYNDFIFSIIAEELGFIGVFIFLSVYLIFIWRCIIVGLRCDEPFGMMIGIGIASLIGIQAFINIGGVTKTIPMTGVPLPFISYGGSSIIMTLTSLGILLNISRHYNKSLHYKN